MHLFTLPGWCSGTAALIPAKQVRDRAARMRGTIVTSPTVPRLPDLVDMMLAERSLPLTFRYGNSLTGEPYTTNLLEAMPLLILDGAGSGLLHKRLVFALLAQFYTKKQSDALHIILMEHLQFLAPLVRGLPRTLFVTTSNEGIPEGVSYLRFEPQKRQQSGQKEPGILTTIEVTPALQQLPVWLEICHLLDQGQMHGIFFIIVATQNGYDTHTMPNVFSNTLLMRPLPTQDLPPCYPLYRPSLPSPIPIFVPQIHPPAMIEKLLQIANDSPSERT